MAVNVKKGSALEGLSLTPLIDVVFMLLIFFLVATRFAEEEREMKVELAQASEAMPLSAPPQETVVNIDAEGQYFVQGQTIPADELYPLLRDVWVNNPTASVIMRIDKRCPHGAVVVVKDACVKANITSCREAVSDEGG